jgi:hypothetical protein
VIAVTDQRTPGWFWRHDRIIDTYGSKLKPIGIAIYVCLARHANDAKRLDVIWLYTACHVQTHTKWAS